MPARVCLDLCCVLVFDEGKSRVMDRVLQFPHIWLPRGFNREKRVHESRIGSPGSMTGGMQNLSGVNTGLYGSNIVPPPLSPLDWWDPDLGAFQSNSGTTPAVANNDPVGFLTGQTGSYGNLIAPAGTTDRPLLKTNFANGHSAILFDGSNDVLKRTATLAKPCTVVMAVESVSWTSLHEVCGAYLAGAAGRVAQYSSTPQLTQISGGGVGPANGNLSVGTFGIVSTRWGNATDDSLRINNVARSVLTYSAAYDPLYSQNFGDFSFGVSYNGSFSNIYVGRIAFYSSELSQGNEDTVVTAFATYYGLSI